MSAVTIETASGSTIIAEGSVVAFDEKRIGDAISSSLVVVS